MKKTLLILNLMILGFGLTLNAQNAKSRLINNNYDEIKIAYQFDIHDLQVSDVKTTNGMYSAITFPDATPTQEIGKPALPINTKLLEIPICQNMTLTIEDSEYEIYDAQELGIEHPILPTQTKYPKSQDGPFPFDIDENTYSTDSFYHIDLASGKINGVLRSINIGTVSVSPVEYNPVTNKIKLYTHLTLKISFENADIPATMRIKSLHGNAMYEGVQSAVCNAMMTEGTRAEFNNNPIKYLIVAHSMFRNNEDLEAFINWKKRIGYLVEVAYTDDSNVGTTTTSIKNFIKSKYDNATPQNPAPTFLLLVGDKAQIPAFTGESQTNHITDLYYACWTNGDNLPDCFYGRFSAQNDSQLTPQVEKTLMYEQYTMPDDSYLEATVLVAGSDYYWSSTHANGQINYLSSQYVNSSNGYALIQKHLYNSSSQAAAIRQEIGAGVGFATYTAHCSSDGWSDPEFESGHISSMNNANKYGLMIGNCCESARFEENSCFAESLLRTPHKGAMAYIGASNSTTWDEDFYWSVGVRNSITGSPSYDASHLGAYDRWFHTHNEDHSKWYVTNGGIITAGNLAVEASSSSSKLYYWEIYHLFGDPSVKSYIAKPSVMNPTLQDAYPMGMQSIDIQAVPYAFIALTKDNELIASTFADATGNATLDLSSATIIPGNYEIAISAQDYVQYFHTIQFIAAEGAYLLTSINLSNFTTIANSSPINFDLTVENMGNDAAQNARVKIEATSGNAFFSIDSVVVGNLNAGQSQYFERGFSGQVAGSVLDDEELQIKVTTYYDNTCNTRDFTFNINAPQLEVSDVYLNNGGSQAVAPGDNVDIHFIVKNAGHNFIDGLVANLQSFNSDITVLTNSVNVGSINSDDDVDVSFNVNISAEAEDDATYALHFYIFNDEYHLNKVYTLAIGTTMEDFETGDFSKFEWQNDNQRPWEITSDVKYAGNYSARSKQNLNNSRSSKLQITMNVLEPSQISYFRKVSSESSYDFFTFSIDNDEKEKLSGEVGWAQASFPVESGTHTFTFKYEKDHSQSSGQDCAWIDNIEFPISGEPIIDNIQPLSIEEISFENTQAGNIVTNGDQPIIKVKFINDGTTAISNVNATLSCATEHGISIDNSGSSSTKNFTSIAAGESKTVAYNISLPASITAHQTFDFNFTLTGGSNNITFPIALQFIRNNTPCSVSVQHGVTTSIYPNPTEDICNIVCDQNMKQIELYDMNGKQIQVINNITDNNCQLNISNLNASIYFVRIITENNAVLTQKIIKK